jgi:uncharacterized protein (DUF1015 family)
VADLRPLRGVHYNPEHVKLGGVLSPPYDVIDATQQEQLYGRDMRNIVRIELGLDYDDDVVGERDRYTRAREHLESWLKLGILVHDPVPSLYVSTHEFSLPSGDTVTRRGLFGGVAAVPWDRSELRPHERTLRGPKEDRLALLRATRMQTSPVFVLAAGAADLDGLLAEIAEPPALLGGRTDGEIGSEKHLLWRCDARGRVDSLTAALDSARLYVADGHHRYETLAAYEEERRQAPAPDSSDSDAASCLVHVVAAGDPALLILPTHRLVRAAHGIAFSLDDLWARLDDAFELDVMSDLERAMARAAELRATHNAFAVVAHDGTAVLSRERRSGLSPRAGLDVSVLEDEVLQPAGVGSEAIGAGALTYTREAAEVAAAVRGGDAVFGFALNPVSVTDVIAVSDAGETMPQKSTYFYPKVPTGLVLNPV